MRLVSGVVHDSLVASKLCVMQSTGSKKDHQAKTKYGTENMIGPRVISWTYSLNYHRFLLKTHI